MSYINLPPVSIGPLGIVDLTPETGGAAAGVGQIGEITTSTVAVATATGVAATNNWGNVTSIILTAGVWEITGIVGFRENGAVLSDHLSVGISNTADGSALSTFDFCQYNQLVSGQDFIGLAPPKLINIAAGGTYYLNTRFVFSSGTPQHYGKITARRYR